MSGGSATLSICWFVALISWAGRAQGGSIDVDLIVNATPFLYSYAVVTTEYSPFGTQPPYVAFSFDLTYAKPPPDSQVILFHQQNINTRILTIDGDWCCTAALHAEGKCKYLGSLNLRGINNWTKVTDEYQIDDSKTIYYWNNLLGYNFEPDFNWLKMEDKIQLNKTGIWYLLLAQCNHTHSVHVKGLLEWRNPVGFLTGLLFAYLPMYFCIATSFLFLFLLWIFFVIKYRGNLLGLQLVVTLAIIIALAENAMWAFNFIDYDLNGKIVDVTNIVCASLTAGKFTIIRLAILLVSLGHSIVVPSLEIKTKLFATLMTLFYFAAATMCTYIWVMSNVNFKFPEILEIITLTSYILINFIYVLWVVISLSRQYKTLYDAHQYEKLSNYKKLVAFLVFFFIISVVVFFCQVASYVLKLRDQYWQVWWIWDAYWEFGYFFVLLLIAGLWWPNKNNKRYAYSTQLDTEDDFPLDDEPHLNVHLEDRDDDDNDNDDIGPGDQQL